MVRMSDALVLCTDDDPDSSAPPKPGFTCPGKLYMLSALIKGNESHCCEECLETVIAVGVEVQFQMR